MSPPTRENAPKGAPKGSAKNHPQSYRDNYAVCGAAARAALAKASPIASRFELRVLNGVVSLTALYSKLWDYVSVSQVAAVAYGIPAESVQGFQRDRTTAALRSLAAQHIIEYSAGRGRGSQPRIGLPIQTRQDDYWIQDGNTRRSGRETHVDAVSKPSTTGGHTEKVFREDLSEGGDCFAEKEDRIAGWLADNLTRFEYERWLEAVDKLRAEGIGDMVIDMAAGKTIQKGDAGPGYLLKVGRDWYSQRVGHSVAP